jgi:hypothetical protein
VSKRGDAINAALDLDETWQDTYAEKWREVAFAHYTELVREMIPAIEADGAAASDAIIEEWVREYWIPFLEAQATAQTEQEYAVAVRIAGNA